MGAWSFPDTNFVVAVATDLSGNVVVASRGAVTSTSPTGLPNFSYVPQQPLLGMAVDLSGNVIVASGDWYSDLTIDKLSSTGASVFRKTIASSGGIEDFKVATDSAGNIIVVAAYQDGTMNFGGTDITTAYMDALVVAKLSSSGSHLFSKIFNPTVAANGTYAGIYEVQLAVKANNEIVVTGTIDGTGKFIMGGKSITLSPAGMETMFLSKFSPTGTTMFAKTVGIDGVHAASIAIDDADNILVTGEDRKALFLGVANGVFMAKYAGGNGNFMSSGLLGGDGWAGTIAISPMTNDAVLSGGTSSNTNYVMQILN
jgi:hypothetical protein